MQLSIDSRSAFIFLISVSLLFVTLLASPTMAEDAGFALRFDGTDDHVQLARTDDLMGATAWTGTKTLSVWVKPASTNAPSTTPPDGELILGNDRPHTFGISRAIFNNADRIWVWNVDSNGMDTIGIEYASDEWVQITMVHANGQLTAFKNGQLVGTVNSGATNLPSSSADGTLYIGGTARNDSDKAFQGEIDEVRIWNAELSQNLIATWMGTELSSTHPEWSSLAAYYAMSNGSGTTLSDDSGHGNSGSLRAGMGDSNWVVSQAFHLEAPTPTSTPTSTLSIPTNTALPTQTNLPPTATPTEFVSPTPTETPTAVFSATATALPPTATPTPTATDTAVALPTATPTPTATDTAVAPPTASPTPTASLLPPSPTANPTATPIPGGGGAGFALAFDGTTDFVVLDETEQILGPGWEDTKTVSLWIRPDSLAGPCDRPTVAWCPAIFGDRPRWWGISIGEVVGLDRIWLWNYDGSANSPIEIIPIDYTPGEWVHIAMVHANGELRGYRNGTLVSTLPSGTTIQPNTGAHPVLHFGGIIVNASRNWTSHSTIDELRLWSIRRSEADIQQDFNRSLSGSESGLRAYYKMSDGSGSTLSDDSSNGWSGTLQDGQGQVPPDGDLPEWVLSDAPIISSGPSATATDLPPSPTPTDVFTATATPDIATSTPTPQASATPTSTATAVLSATPTMAATATALPPTSTPTATNLPPTATATPIATIQATPTQSVSGLTQIGHLNTDGFSYDVALDGSTLYLADTRGGLLIVDIQDPSTPTELALVDLPSRNYGVAVDGNYVYATTTRDGVFVIDVSDPTNPAITAQFTGTTYAWKVSVKDGYAYIADRLEGLYILDVTDPSQPQQIAFYATADQSLDTAHYLHYVYLADYRAGVHVLDVSDPANPLYLGTISTGSAYSVTVDQGRLFVSDGSSGMSLFDLTDPANPAPVSSFPTSGSIRDIAVEGNIAYLADWTNGLHAVDIADPSQPTNLDTLTTSGASVGVRTQAGLVYLADYQNGLLIVQGP